MAIDDEMAVTNFREAKAFRLAYELAMEIFEISKAFPKEERYSLTDQIRRSSRSVCANIGEAYRKELIQLTLFLKVLTQMLRIARQEFGLISHSLVNTFQPKYTKS